MRCQTDDVRVAGPRQHLEAEPLLPQLLVDVLGVPGNLLAGCVVLTEWEWDDGLRGWGEDHDNWSAQAFRQFIRGERGTRS